MSVRKAWDHKRRPKTDKTYCGLPWVVALNRGGAKREACPTCTRRENRGH
jgi:hypothetical protein